VLFGDALQHVVRLARVLTQPRGHAILVGLTGVGRSSCLRLAATLSGVVVAAVEFANSAAVVDPIATLGSGGGGATANPKAAVTSAPSTGSMTPGMSAVVTAKPARRRGEALGVKRTHTGYRTTVSTGAHVEFRERLKRVLFDAGVHNKPTALHLQHVQIVSPELDASGGGVGSVAQHTLTTDHDLIMDDIHQLLECGEVPGLFEAGGANGAADEVAEIVNEIRVQAERASSRIAERELAAAFKTNDTVSTQLFHAPGMAVSDDPEEEAMRTADLMHSASSFSSINRVEFQTSTEEEVDRHAFDPAGTALPRATTRAECWEVFMTRVVSNLHIVLSMSAAGSGIRARLRAYPSLLAHCYWDYFLDWSPEALVAVAHLHLDKLTFALPDTDEGGMGPIAAAAAGSGSTDLIASALNKSQSDSDVTGAEAADERLRSSLAVAACNIYLTVPVACASYGTATRRAVYVTPKSYFEWMAAFSNTWNARRARLVTLLDRLYNGIATIESTNAFVSTLRVTLTAMQPVLAQKRAEAQRLLEEVSTQRAEAESVASRVAIEEEEVSAAAASAAELAADAKRDLDAAMPALEAAQTILESLDKKDIVEMKVGWRSVSPWLSIATHCLQAMFASLFFINQSTAELQRSATCCSHCDGGRLCPIQRDDRLADCKAPSGI
jgi:hypothetical protein